MRSSGFVRVCASHVSKTARPSTSLRAHYGSHPIRAHHRGRAAIHGRVKSIFSFLTGFSPGPKGHNPNRTGYAALKSRSSTLLPEVGDLRRGSDPARAPGLPPVPRTTGCSPWLPCRSAPARSVLDRTAARAPRHAPAFGFSDVLAQIATRMNYKLPLLEKISSIRQPKAFAILNASGRLGSCFSVSIAFTVCHETPSRSANSPFTKTRTPWRK